ncbi:MAG: Crp/Fnr family transcriptional regulator [Eubacteriales bacterium]|nr:Crp/Fnr family transcriptional regulator [Eubacteriales bacterium]
MSRIYDSVLGNLESPWVSLDVKFWGDLIKDAPRRRIHADQDIFWPGKESTAVYIVAGGRFCVRMIHESGFQKHVYIACPGAMIGETDCILGCDHSMTATAIMESEVYCIPRMELMRQFQTNQTLASHLLRYGSRKNRMLIYQVSMLSFNKSSQRIASLLICLCENYGMETEEGIYLNLRFTCAEMASIANTSRVTANNTMLLLMEKGIVEKKHGKYLVKDLIRLHEIELGEMIEQ